MAKYTVDAFTITQQQGTNGHPEISLVCAFKNEKKNALQRGYSIRADTRQPDLNHLEAILRTGFETAKATGAKVEVTEYPERVYLLFTLPPTKDIIQVTGERL